MSILMSESFERKHFLGKFLGKIGLTYTCRTQEHEYANRMVRVAQAYAVLLEWSLPSC